MVLRLTRHAPPAECIRLFEADAGLDAIIVIHSAASGPGLGRCDLVRGADTGALLDAALRRAEAAGYSAAMAGLPFGGASAVVREPPPGYDRARLFRALGRAIDTLDGIFVASAGAGTGADDMREMASETRHVAGVRPDDARGQRDAAYWTASGVFEAMRAAARQLLGTNLRGLAVAIQGTGDVGSELCRRLAGAGALLVIADPRPERRDRLRHILGAAVVSPAEIAKARTDIFAPCAPDVPIEAADAASMRARIVCGGAHDQLASPDVANMLHRRGIFYVPDFVANAGGTISNAADYRGAQASLDVSVRDIAATVSGLIERARSDGCSALTAAETMAEDRSARFRRPHALDVPVFAKL